MEETVEMKVEKVYATPEGVIFVVTFPNISKMIYKYRIKGDYELEEALPYIEPYTEMLKGKDIEEVELSEYEKLILFNIFASDSVPIRWARRSTSVRDAVLLSLKRRALYLIPE